MAINWNQNQTDSSQGGINWTPNQGQVQAKPTIAGLPTGGQGLGSVSDSIWQNLADVSHGAAKGAIGGIAGTAGLLASGGGLIEKGLDQTIGRVGNGIAGKGFVPSNTAAAPQQGASDLNAVANMPSLAPTNTAQGIGSVIGQGADALVTPPGEFAAKGAGTVIGKGAEVVGDALEAGQTALKTSRAAQATKDAASAQQRMEQQAIKDATPAYSGKIIKDQSSTVGGLPRVSEGSGFFGTRSVAPTSREVAAGQELVHIPGYATAKTALEKYNLIQPEIASEAQSLSKSLANEKVLRPPQEIKAIVGRAVDEASQNSLLLQKTDPIVQNYLRVTDRAIQQSDGTLAGELRVRQLLDNAYEDAGGKYTANKGLDQIHNAARDAINDDLEAKANSTEVKASLRRQSLLYKAGDVLFDKAKAEGGSKFLQLTKEHPIATKVIKKAADYVGVGQAVDLLR